MADTVDPQSANKEHFPAGLRVLVVDDDLTTLLILKQMLRTCLYQVTICEKAAKALDFLRKNKGEFDIIISDVHMPDMDGFKLLELVGLEMDLPVIMMSANDDPRTVMKGIIHGACDYLLKPVQLKEFRNIWQHVVRKKIKVPEKQSQGSPLNEGALKRKKDAKEDEEQETSSKRVRVVWTVELHKQFVNAVNHLGLDRAFPKQILELMNIPGLTRENVASHLQKYRLYLRRTSGMDFLQSNGRLDSSPAEALDFHGFSTVGSNAPTNSGTIGLDPGFFAQTASLARPLYLQQQQQQQQQQRHCFPKQFSQGVRPTSPDVGIVGYQSRRLLEELNHRGGIVNPPQTIEMMPESWQGDICFDAQILKSHLHNPLLQIDRWNEENVEFMVGTKAVNNARVLESFSAPDDLLSIFLNQQQEGSALMEDFLLGGYGLNHMYTKY